ncbi:apolipoprotein N-acyltransferase [Photobacterium aphoticum]|uniref:Apolipoprotein N-acyltransferase n=1 Tax=Photobacterium aphoticum TaxID=754436 RepID=A0A0J1JCD0_9GAMM|nr:apolipoprotein N-acyltransferase [Photobacterium aphoticum]KLU99241.1 apolipoprotein acyltransferase [Photobacterium aphoticum]PSU56250.1 apolipoprotein N-acyltransferase [Photobacterium aphoticum]GHA62952.1 apolipoprotein N-acyltransferase [Photobacterium aphoticum]
MTKKTLMKLGQLFAAVPAGALATLSFAPYNYWPLALVSLCLLFALLLQQTPKRGALIGFLWGLGLFGTGISWVHVSIANFGGMPWLAGWSLMALLIAYLAFYPALFGFLFNRFNRGRPFHQLMLSGPVFWLILDWIRGWLMTGFPWLWMGYSQIDSPYAAIAPILGVEGITLALVLTSAALVAAAYYRNWRPLLVVALVGAISLLAGQKQWVVPNPDKTVDVAMIQGNVPQEIKWLPSQRWPTLMKYTDLTRENWGADLIIWPEAAIPALETQVPTFLQNLDAAARNNHSTVITGILDQNEKGQFYNNILTLGVNAVGPYQYEHAERYSKHHLLPFGEFVPFGDLLRPIAPFFNLPMSSFSRGDYIQPNLEANGYSLAPALCYEVAFSEQVRQNVDYDTEFLLTLSNDTWFGKSIGPFQHMEIAQMRALELGKPLLRATNSGLTGVVDHHGQIIASIPQFETAVLRTKVTPTEGMTPFTSLGSWPLYVYVLWALTLSWVLARRQQGRFRDQQPEINYHD